MRQPNCIRIAHARAYAEEENRSNEGNDKNEGNAKNEGVGGI